MSNIRDAVAKRDEAAVDRQQLTPAQALGRAARQAIEHHADMLDAVLPAHVDRRRFSQMVLMAVKQAPDLAGCFATQQGGASFLLAVGQAAIVGLEPNTPTQECWILPRKASRKDGGHQEAKLEIGYRGLLKLARRTGNVRTVVAEVVYEADHFLWERGLADDRFEHRPAAAARSDRGAITHAYAIVRFHDGGYQFHICDRDDLDARRAMSDSWKADQKYGNSYSPWSNYEAAMCRKSAIRGLASYLDLSVDVQRVLERDEAARPAGFDLGTGQLVDAYAELGSGDDDEGSPAADGLGDDLPADDDGAPEGGWPPGEEPFE